MTQTVGILVYPQVETLDVAGPFEVFSVAVGGEGDVFRVVTVADGTDPVPTIGGLSLLPHHDLSDAPDLDILVVPGGDGSKQAMTNDSIVDWVRDRSDDTEIVMAVCSGARILARAGLLGVLEVTTHHMVLDHLAQLEPTARIVPTKRYIDTGPIMTTGGISAGIDGSLHLVARLLGDEAAESTAAYMEYRWEREPDPHPGDDA